MWAVKSWSSTPLNNTENNKTFKLLTTKQLIFVVSIKIVINDEKSQSYRLFPFILLYIKTSIT